MNDYRELMRRKLLEQMYDKMSDEEKRTFVQLTIQNKDHTEIMQALKELKTKADSNHHSWINDFGANIAGNAVWETILWLGSKFFGRP